MQKQRCAFCFINENAVENESKNLIKNANIKFIISFNNKFDIDESYLLKEKLSIENFELFVYAKDYVFTPKENICYIVQTSGTVSMEKTIVYVENYCIESNVFHIR